MRIFISWSGPESHTLAKVIYKWLPTVLPFVEPWLSSEDIAKGQRWAMDIARRLEDSSYCIVCVTPGVAQQPWVNFEAGAVSKAIRASRVSPLLFGVTHADFTSLPLAMFQCTTFQKDDVHKLLRSVNEASESPVSNSRIRENLNYTWARLSREVKSVKLSSLRPTAVSEQDDMRATADWALSVVEMDIMTLIARRYDGDVWVSEWEFSHESSQSSVRIRHALDHLVRLNLLNHYSDGDERSYQLTEAGVECVVALDLE